METIELEEQPTEMAEIKREKELDHSYDKALSEHHFTHPEFGQMDIRYLDSPDSEDFQCHMVSNTYRPKQFFIGHTLYREKEARKVGFDELFLDLIYVASVSKLCGISWINISDFIILFFPVFMTWGTITTFYNRYGNNDIFHRLLLYFSMIITAGMALNTEFALNSDYSQNTSSIFISTFLVLRIAYIAFTCSYAVLNPEFRGFILLTTIYPFFSCIPYFVSIFITDKYSGWISIRRSLWWTSLVLDMSLFMFSMLAIKFARRLSFFKNRVAMNIEHMTERMGLFVIIVLGEFVFSVVFSSQRPKFSFPYLHVIFALIIAISFQWMYFSLLDGHGGKSTHPLRSNIFKGVSWLFIHVPLCGGLIAAGAGLGLVVRIDPTDTSSDVLPDGYTVDQIKCLIGGSLIASIISITILSSLFSSQDPDSNLKEIFSRRRIHLVVEFNPAVPKFLRKSKMRPLAENEVLIPRLPKYFRLFLRLGLACLILIIVYVGNNLSVTGFLAVLASLMFFEVFLEEFGKKKVIRTQ